MTSSSQLMVHTPVFRPDVLRNSTPSRPNVTGERSAGVAQCTTIGTAESQTPADQAIHSSNSQQAPREHALEEWCWREGAVRDGSEQLANATISDMITVNHNETNVVQCGLDLATNNGK